MNIEDVLKGHGIGAGGGSNIKSIQRVTVTLTAETTNYTISNVDMSKAIVLCKGTAIPSGTSGYPIVNYTMKASLTSNTNVSIKVYGYNATSKQIAYLTIIEFNHAKVQRGENTIVTTNIGGTNSSPVTIQPVKLEKSLILHTFICATGGGSGEPFQTVSLFGSSTLLYFYMPSNGFTYYYSWQVIEFE